MASVAKQVVARMSFGPLQTYMFRLVGTLSVGVKVPTQVDTLSRWSSRLPTGSPLTLAVVHAGALGLLQFDSAESGVSLLGPARCSCATGPILSV